MSEHPIKSLMSTVMENMKDMVDVNTIVGDAVQAPDDTVIIPISRVSFGFAAGGSEFGVSSTFKSNDIETSAYPFGGGSGAGVSINPVAFMVVGQGQIKLLPVSKNATSIDKMFDVVPQLMSKLNEYITDKLNNKKDKSKNPNSNINVESGKDEAQEEQKTE